MSMRDQFEDLKYLVSKNNQTSRGFYIMLVVFFSLLIGISAGLFVFAILGKVTGGWRYVSFLALPVTLIIFSLIVKLLSK